MQEKSKELLQDYDITLPLSAIYELNIKELKVLATLININDNGLNIIWDISDLLIYINYSKQAISKIINKLISLNYVEIFKHSLYGNIYRVKRRKTLIDTEESFIKNPSNKRNFSTRIKLKKMIQQNNICASCKSKLNETCQADHIIPYSKGGKTVEDNCQVLCRKCNASKGNRNE